MFQRRRRNRNRNVVEFVKLKVQTTFWPGGKTSGVQEGLRSTAPRGFLKALPDDGYVPAEFPCFIGLDLRPLTPGLGGFEELYLGAQVFCRDRRFEVSLVVMPSDHHVAAQMRDIGHPRHARASGMTKDRFRILELGAPTALL